MRSLATSSHLPTKMYGHPPLGSFINVARHNEVPIGKDYEVFNPVFRVEGFFVFGLNSCLSWTTPSFWVSRTTRKSKGDRHVI
jgi:hypothetical protein